MPRTVRGGLIQAKLCTPATAPVAAIKKAMIDKHVALIAEAAGRGAQVVCLQELFYGPYFCAEQETRWYDLTERVPDGPTTRLMIEVATKHGIVLIVPVYEEDLTGRLLQHGSRDRRGRPLPGQVPQDASAALSAGLLGEVLLPARQPWLPRLRYESRQGRRLYLLRPPLPGGGTLPGSERGRDRVQSFGDGRRALRVPLEARAARRTRWPTATSSARSTGPALKTLADRRVLRSELLLRPAGQMLAVGRRDDDDIVVADLDLDQIREVRNTWQFYRDRRPETYGASVQL